ncbi:AAA family ATPase [Oxynema sp. CENA135]|uniref:AAA family ATPase n=1 Tax=Oxynema sp. CENA135 TaxID=984206 RepID=UPI001909FEA1|nr:AAA family ATPase [Oxynema sp. CENA135]MBK4731858.1 AAA family ATPase [Oxynema sp. CENA135]
MRLRSIELNNFRQFYGKTPEIQLANGSKNTTVIYGNNGSGKTTLLNAFTWVLYEKFSAAFAAPEQLVNKRAIAEAKPRQAIDCWVSLDFDHENKRYRVRRAFRAYKDEFGAIEQTDKEVFLQIAGDDGRWHYPDRQPEEIIGAILPGSLHQYFFFDGERIEQIVRLDKKSEIAEATKELLGIKILNRSIDHLKACINALEQELKDIGDPETQKLLKDKDKLSEERERLKHDYDIICQELDSQETVKKTLGDRLRQLDDGKQWQEKRQELEKRERETRHALIQARNNFKNAVATRGYMVFLNEAIANFQTLVEDLRRKGELPTGIKRQFVEQLLARERCICGSELLAGTDSHERVCAWMDKAGIAEVEESAIRMSAQVEEIEKQIPQFWEETDREQAKINQHRMEISRIETQLDDLKKKLRTFPNEDIQKLQQRLDETEASIRELTLQQGINQQKRENLKTEIEHLGDRIAKHQMLEAKQTLAQRRIAATLDAMQRLSEVRSRIDRQFRLQLERRVQELFSQISFTPYLPKLSEKYELTLVENTAGIELPVAASTGENQILSLSFIGGIIDRVREWSKNRMLMGPDSSMFPIVMDSPFGSLDEIYRRQVANCIPKLANQLVVLVTKTQWRGEVEREMSDCIGKEYILVYYSPKADCEEDEIHLKSASYPLVRKSPNDFEYTEIIEVFSEN